MFFLLLLLLLLLKLTHGGFVRKVTRITVQPQTTILAGRRMMAPARMMATRRMMATIFRWVFSL